MFMKRNEIGDYLRNKYEEIKESEPLGLALDLTIGAMIIGGVRQALVDEDPKNAITGAVTAFAGVGLGVAFRPKYPRDKLAQQ